MTVDEIMMSPGGVPDKISKLLRQCFISPHLLGFDYISEAIGQVYLGGVDVHRVTKELYPTVAKLHDTTPSKVERAMRHAIDYGWKMSQEYGSEVLEEMFNIPKRKLKPTNSEFVATFVDLFRRYGI